jgi:hypothetical protein
LLLLELLPSLLLLLLELLPSLLLLLLGHSLHWQPLHLP